MKKRHGSHIFSVESSKYYLRNEDFNYPDLTEYVTA